MASLQKAEYAFSAAAGAMEGIAAVSEIGKDITAASKAATTLKFLKGLGSSFAVLGVVMGFLSMFMPDPIE